MLGLGHSIDPHPDRVHETDDLGRQRDVRTVLVRATKSFTYPRPLIIQSALYHNGMLTSTTRLDVMHRLGRAMADPTRSRILMTLLDGPSYPALLASDLGLTRQNVSNHLACLRDCGIVVAEPEGRQSRYEISDPHLARALSELVGVVLAVDESAECIDPTCSLPGCCEVAG